MRKKQSVTQRVVLDDEATEEKGETSGDPDRVEEQELNPNGGDAAQEELLGTSKPRPTKESSQSVETQKMDTVTKGGRSEGSSEQHNLFDEDGNAILPDGTLIIQPTDVDGDRPSSGPAAAPSEGSSLQFDFKDGNPDPKYIMSSQSMGGSGSSMTGAASEPGVLDVVKCTTCTTKLNPYHKDDLAVHPVLKVITCKRCMRWYNSVDWSKDEDGKDNQCRWCGEGGQLICCDVCHNTFCKTCIKRNLGRTVLQEIEDLPEDALWRCYVCDQGPLLPLQQGCAQIIEKVEAYRMGKLQRKFKLQTGKKQVENKKPMPTAPTTVTVSVTPVPGVRPQIGVRMTTPSVVTSSTHPAPRSSVTSTSVNSAARQQLAARFPPSMPRGPRLPLPNSGIIMKPGSAGNVAHRPTGNVMPSTQPGRFPGTAVGRSLSTMRAMRPVGRTSNSAVGHTRSVPGSQPINVAAAAGSSAATEEWYEQNCSLREILREVNSVDPSNIELALKTTLKELQSWTRKCNHLENELRGALNDAQRRTVVHKFKSTFRLNLLLRLGKIHTLMQKESGLQMAVAAQRSAVMAAQAQARSSHLPAPVLSTNAKKMIVPGNRPGIPMVSNRLPTSRMPGGVIDLTEDHSSASTNRILPSAAAAMSAIGSRVPVKSVQQPGLQLNNSVATTSGRSKVRQRASNSTHVNLLSSEDEDDDDGMVDDRTDKTWSGSAAPRPSGLRRKSARLAAKTTTPGSEGSDSSQGADGVDESDDSQSRLLVRIPCVKRGKRSKKTDEESKKTNVDDSTDKNEAKPSSSASERVDDLVKEETTEVVLDSSALTGKKADNDNNADDSKEALKKVSDASETVNSHDKKENGETSVYTNGISNANDNSNSQDKTAHVTNQKSSGDNQIPETSSSVEPEEKTEHHSPSPPTSDFVVQSQAADDEPCSDASEHEDDENGQCADKQQTVDPTSNQVVGSNQNSAVATSPGSETDPSKQCITVSMWGSVDGGKEGNMDTNESSVDNDSCVGSLKGKRRASELDDESAKRQKLDQ